eukprot:TRINITY_DN9124_c0_g1_i1.p1 TRINITY_DN9124_c0_g1~~TRINITY_DN9124_c0_g1_i1.p1  ORF type:complete len:247 (+),score=38.92 TRINITY_DN9124_c0_g1_i1:41-742(+)
MAFLYKDLSTDTAYIDRKPMIGMPELERMQYEEKYREGLRKSKTVYVGNLSFNINEQFLHDLFSSVGEVTDIIMGLDRIKKSPCGFCFVEYATHGEADDCVKYLNGRKICNRAVRVDWDLGNVRKENRYWGRGASGGQVRDEYRSDYDPERGGLGVRSLESITNGEAPQSHSTTGARVYGTWAYTPFNTHKAKAAGRKAAREREEERTMWAGEDNPYADYDRDAPQRKRQRYD